MFMAVISSRPRSEWDAETLVEQPCDPVRMAGRFEEANARLKGN
jgi:hypothetical protein